MTQYMLAMDQGTTSSRSILFDKKGNAISVAQKEFKQYAPYPGWVEHDPIEIWETQTAVTAEATTKAGLNSSFIAGVGITNQRETVVIWNRHTGEPIYNAIVWLDNRTADYCQQLREEGKSELIQEKTGLVIDPYFSATKIRWILDNVPHAREQAEAGDLLFGTTDTWLVWKLTKGNLHITDYSNASRTMLFDIHNLQWDQELLDLFGIPRAMLPEVRDSSEVYGYTKTTIFASEIPIAGIAGDQQSALFGQRCTQKGMAKNTYGTGCFVLMNVGEEPVFSQNKLLSTVAWKIGDRVEYALEGSIFMGGAVVQWLRDGLGIIASDAKVEELAQEVQDTAGVVFVPTFAGLGAPYWNANAQGTLFGVTRSTTKAHLARASLKAIAYQTMDVLRAMEADSGVSIQKLRVDGGASVNDLMMQQQAEILQTQVDRPDNTETTAMGAAFLAGLALNFWESEAEIESIWKLEQSFIPQADPAEVEAGIQQWHDAIDALQYYADRQAKAPAYASHYS